MKKILFLCLILFSATASAQVINFRTTSYTYKEYTYYGWSDWHPYQKSNMLLVIDMNVDLVTIYSPKVQVYRILEYEGTYKDRDGDKTAKFRFIDNDGDIGTMRLVQRRNGKSEVYIDFANVVWVYSVVRMSN